MRYEEKMKQLVPEHMWGAVRLYLENGIEPGSFLMSVLENNLKNAVAYADNINRDRLFDIVFFLYNFFPAEAWGSEKKVEEWIQYHSKNSQSYV